MCGLAQAALTSRRALCGQQKNATGRTRPRFACVCLPSYLAAVGMELARASGLHTGSCQMMIHATLTKVACCSFASVPVVNRRSTGSGCESAISRRQRQQGDLAGVTRVCSARFLCKFVCCLRASTSGRPCDCVPLPYCFRAYLHPRAFLA